MSRDPSTDEPGAGDDRGDDVARGSGAGGGEERIEDAAPQHTALWVVLSRWLLGAEAWLRSHGGARLRNGIRAFWAVLGIGGLVLLFGPVINAPMTLEDITGSADTATDTWIAREFAVEYDIERGGDGRLTAHVVERITAYFPDDVEEHGIRRVLATQYQGHDLAPSNLEASVDGTPVEASQRESADRLTVELEPSTDDPEPLEGDHEFLLRYDLHDLAYVASGEPNGSGTDTDPATAASPDSVDLLEWDVFGPDWRQALAGLDVAVTLPDDVDAHLVRQPRGTLAWLLIGGGEWLSPEAGSPANAVTYRFTNDQNIPPYAQARFAMSFEPGTFTMPAPTFLYQVQVYGPLAPLAVLVVTLLLALAARAVAWSDARGRPWFVAQYDPPKGLTPREAAQVLRAPLAAELAGALQRAQSDLRPTKKRRFGRSSRTPGPNPARQTALRDVARVAARAGRLGDRPRALARYLTARERAAQLSDGIRRIPHGFVRDLFIAAPLALTLVQWGLVRQLSHQTVLAVVWWPVAFVLVSSAIALVVLVIALTSRPLTEKGALLKQHLLGVGVYAERTRLLERGPLRESIVPYAVLLAPPREAGENVVGLVTQELGGDPSRGWRDRSFLGGGRIVIRSLALLAVVGAVAAVALLPPPYPRSYDYATYSGDVPGALFTTVQSFDAAAELSRTDDGRARLAVTEKLDVTFDDEGSQVPQFAQQWPAENNGQNLGLRVEAVRVDDTEVPFGTRPDADTLLLSTRLTEVLSSSHEVEVDYVLDSAAVAAAPVSGSATPDAAVDSVRWAALLEGWQYDSTWDEDPGLDPLRLELRMSDELAEQAVDGGWLTLDTESSDDVRSWADDVVPFGSVDVGSAGGDTVESSGTADGVRSFVLDLDRGDSGGWPFDLTVDDVGGRIDFPAGTFDGPDPGALGALQAERIVPVATVIGLAGLALLLGVIGLAVRRSRRPLVAEGGALRDLVRWLAPALALAALILFVWMTADMPDDWPEFRPLGLSALAALAGGTLALVSTRRAKPARTP